MLRIAAVVGVLAAAALSAGCGASYPPGFSDLRVCAASEYKDGSCGQNQLGTPILADSFYCTAKLGDRGGEQFTGRWYYEGLMLA